ncbi:MAG: hypothetical protein AB1634_04535 [Thermodesulfobacteriota bacterium]
MNTVSVPILPAGLWLLATAGVIIIMLIIFGMYLYHQRRFSAALGDSRDASSLAARKEQLQSDVQGLRDWFTAQKDELVRLDSERVEQERLRGELTRLQHECAAEEQRNVELRREAGEFEAQRHTISQVIERLNHEAEDLRHRIEDLERQRAELVSVETQLKEIYKSLDAVKQEWSAAQKEREDVVRQVVERRIELDALRRECDGLDRHRVELMQQAENAKTENERAHREAEESSRQLLEITQQVQLQKGVLIQAEDRIHDFERGIRRLEEEKAGFKQEMADLEKDREVAEVSAKEAEEKARRRMAEAEESGKILGDMSRQVQEKHHELSLKEELLQSLVRQVQQLERTKSNIEQALADAQRKVPESEKAVQYWDDQTRRAEASHLAMTSRLKKAEDRLEEVENKEKRLGIEVAVLEGERDRLRKEVGGLEGGGGPEMDNAHADLLKKAPDCLDPSHLPKKEFPYSDEEGALAEICRQLADVGYHFQERVVKAFHTALKCHDINPLTVLAGVSGTGKTLLPTAYARLMGMHSLVIAVQPRWDSPQDMFGFYNYLEKKYKATDLARALIRMDRSCTVEGLDEKQKCSDRMLLVLLDEMNLARTEYYFSEFLSKLELRRLADRDHQHDTILLDTGPGREAIKFCVGQNVLFTGTMNEDESTQTLSDKVLDRANVLRFGRPAKTGPAGPQQIQERPLPQPLGYLKAEQWAKWCRPVESADWTEKAQEWINGLNDALTRVGRPFGHRVRKSILAYVANYPGVTRDVFKDAFADQIEQKILPKLRGFDTTEGINNAAFDDIGKIIEDTGDGELHKAFATARESNASGMFLWQGVTRQDDQA